MTWKICICLNFWVWLSMPNSVCLNHWRLLVKLPVRCNGRKNRFHHHAECTSTWQRIHHCARSSQRSASSLLSIITMMAPHAAERGNLGERAAYTTPSEVEKVLEAPDRRPTLSPSSYSPPPNDWSTGLYVNYLQNSLTPYTKPLPSWTNKVWRTKKIMILLC